MSTLLEINELKTHFPLYKGVLLRRLAGTIRAVDGVNLTLEKGEILGLAGESGCGKSTLGRTIMQLTRPVSGSVVMNGKNLAKLSRSQLRQTRRDFQMIFQDPYASLNPRFTIFETLAEPLLYHGLCTKNQTLKRVHELMEMVGLASRLIKKYPHEFSGGQRQRIAIARALALKPKLIVADEPVSALDVSIQSQILNLLMDLRQKFELTLLFISHDLSVVRHIANRVAIMYLGKIVEIGPSEQVFAQPTHPYTRALLSAIPLPDPRQERQRERIILSGDPPSPLHPPPGCPFHPRCPFAENACTTIQPQLESVSAEHKTACLRWKEI